MCLLESYMKKKIWKKLKSVNDASQYIAIFTYLFSSNYIFIQILGFSFLLLKNESMDFEIHMLQKKFCFRFDGADDRDFKEKNV